MKLLIVCATPAEFNHQSIIEKQKETIPGSYVFFHKNIEITLLVTGVGMINTTYFLQKKLTEKKFDLALNVGIAGCFNKNIPLGTVFHVTSDCFAEPGAEDGDSFISIFDLGLMKKDQFPFYNGKLLSHDSFISATLELLPEAFSITVNKVHGNAASIEKVRMRLNPDLETMEGAAFFYVCLQENIPFIQLRSVSNIIEKRNRDAWNIPLALKNLQQTADEFLEELSLKYPI
jgi:futalosine hydrolase